MLFAAMSDTGYGINIFNEVLVIIALCIERL